MAQERGDEDQLRLIGTPLDRLLVVQGGPGTGKTLVALRRVARLIDQGELTPSEVLVAGPSPAFARHTRDTLSSWGVDGVDHRDVHRLHPPVDPHGRPGGRGRAEAPYVHRLKGEARMAGLLSRALSDRPDPDPDDLPSEISVGGRSASIDPGQLRRVVVMANASRATPGDRERILRGMLAAGGAEAGLIREGAEALAGLIWPPLAPAEFLRDLLGSPPRLAAAAGDEFTEREIAALHRVQLAPGAGEVWSDADLPLLDEVDQLLDNAPRQYAHIVVDGVLDLSPMQLRAVARRSATGSMTVVGDPAQSTGPWARDDWDDVLTHLPQKMPQVDGELTYGYRVPRRIFDLAVELLPTAAPGARPPTVVRDGPGDPTVEPVEPPGRAPAVVAAAVHHASRGRSVAIICPGRCHAEIEARLRDEDVLWQTAAADGPGRSITLVSPPEAKGLEFDAVIVVEPGDIVDDDPRGHRLLYLALTRPTRHLHLVGAAADLPLEFAALTEPVAPQPEPEPATTTPGPEPEPDYDPAVREAIDLLAHSFAEALLANLTPPLWNAVLRRLAKLIEPFDPDA